MGEFKEIGEVHESRRRYEWKVDNFLSLLEERYDGCYFSQVFHCGSNAWYLELLPNLLVEDQNRLSLVEIGLHRVCRKGAERVTMSVGVCRVDGTEIEVLSRTETLAEEQKYCKFPLLEKGDFLVHQRRFLSSGTLTVFLYMNSEVVIENSNNAEEEQILDEKSHLVLRRDLWQLFKAGEGADVTFRVADRDFRAHRSVLRARSPVFNGMLAHDMAESNSGVVTIDDCAPKVFKLFLRFVYTGVVEVSSADSAIPLFFLADKYDFPALRAQCLQFLVGNLATPSVCDVVRLAVLHGEEGLLDAATEFFAEHVEEILKGEAWLDFLKEDPDQANRLFKNALKVLSKSTK